MVEYIGAAAAVAQLAKYGLDIANGIPEIATRVRQAPALLRRWTDHASLLVSLAQTLHHRPALLRHVQPEVIARLSTEAGSVASLLRDLVTHAGDGRAARIRKRIHILRKENEIDKALGSIAVVGHALQAHILLPRRKSSFIGRKLLLHTLLRSLSGAHNVPVVLTGLGGIGKTEVAVELSHMLQDHDSYLSVLWFDGSIPDSSTIAELLLELLHQISSDSTKMYLLIFDDIDMATLQPDILQAILRQSGTVRVLVTTRNFRYALQLVDPERIIEVPYMGQKEATSLLLSYTGPGLGSVEEAASLACALDYLPLALVQSGLYIHSTFTKLNDFLRIISDDNYPFATAFEPGQSATSVQGQSQRSPHSILSLENITYQNAHALHILFCLACFHPEALPEILLTALTRTRKNGYLGHDDQLLDCAAMNRLRSKSSAAHYHQGLFEIAARVTWEATRSQIIQIGEHHVDTLHSLNNLGVIYHDQGRFLDAESCHEKALHIKQQLFGRRHPETFVTMNNLALSLQSQQRHADANELFKAALCGRRMPLDASSLDFNSV
ncbi:hypothetical protein BU23DRAFT_658064 [Bimuria novae-zelandiae CBS 107.79]|uniref:AAA+ ATPase domain-containing protein n=1 Tax=Bimuria novae-zelandiae CBS 107.79 TaxID=1447943 RepID=A0A6A5UYB4_9PLEO|nr:hypothetical protein BU23DRAFT_658064 [Bimuria novae-zelandiae CBS 107.79]